MNGLYVLELIRKPGTFVMREEDDQVLVFYSQHEAEQFLWSRDSLITMMFRVRPMQDTMLKDFE